MHNIVAWLKNLVERCLFISGCLITRHYKEASLCIGYLCMCARCLPASFSYIQDVASSPLAHAISEFIYTRWVHPSRSASQYGPPCATVSNIWWENTLLPMYMQTLPQHRPCCFTRTWWRYELSSTITAIEL